MDHKENMSVFGIRPLMEAVDSGKIPDKIFIQRGLAVGLLIPFFAA